MKTILKSIYKLIILLIVVAITLLGVFVFSEYLHFKEFKDSGEWDKKLAIAMNKEDYSKFEELPKRYIDAIVSVEDKRFLEHEGVDIKAIAKALYNNFRRKDLLEGGSTITQQLAKNIFYTQDTSISRKINEMFAAIELERNFSKEEIFELYVNNMYFGSGYYTIKEAAEGYFGKTLDELDLNELTFLAGVPNAPSVYDPRINPDLAKERQLQVLYQMKRNNKLTSEEEEKIKAQPIKVVELR